MSKTDGDAILEIWEFRKEMYYKEFDKFKGEELKPDYNEILEGLYQINNIYYPDDRDDFWINLCKPSSATSDRRYITNALKKFNTLSNNPKRDGDTKYSESQDVKDNDSYIEIKDSNGLEKDLKYVARKVFYWAMTLYESNKEYRERTVQNEIKGVINKDKRLGKLPIVQGFGEDEEDTGRRVIKPLTIERDSDENVSGRGQQLMAGFKERLEQVKKLPEELKGLKDNTHTNIQEGVQKAYSLRPIENKEKELSVSKPQEWYKKGEEIGKFRDDNLSMISNTGEDLKFYGGNIVSDKLQIDKYNSIISHALFTSLTLLLLPLIFIDPVFLLALIAFQTAIYFPMRDTVRTLLGGNLLDISNKALEEDVKYLNTVHLLEDETPVRLYEVLYVEDSKVKISTDLHPITEEDTYKTMVVDKISKDGVVELYESMYEENINNQKALGYEQELHQLEKNTEDTQKALEYVGDYHGKKEQNKHKLGLYHRMKTSDDNKENIESDMDKLLKENTRLKEDLSKSIKK